MKKDIKNSLLNYINDLLKLEIWRNNKALIMHNCDMNNYIDYADKYNYLKQSEFELLLETLQAYEEALIHHDWLLEDRIIGLTIPQAYLFLKEIKQMLESDIEDEKIENMLIEKYHEVKNSKQGGKK